MGNSQKSKQSCSEITQVSNIDRTYTLKGDNMIYNGDYTLKGHKLGREEWLRISFRE